RVDRVDELTWMRPVQDLREEQNLCLDPHVFESAVDRGGADMMRSLDKDGVNRAVSPIRRTDSRSEGRVIRFVYSKPRDRRIGPPLVTGLELLGLVQEAV